MTSAIVPEYTRGEWVAVVTPGRVALLPAATPAATVQRLWASMRAADEPSLVDHLQVLAAGDLTAMPPFALLTITDARLHAVVRGAVQVEVVAAGRTRVLTAPHVSTWSEEVVEGVERVEVRAPGDGDGDGDGAGHDAEALPVVSGVVRAGAVRVPGRPTEPAVAPEPAEPVVEPQDPESPVEPERAPAIGTDGARAPVRADDVAVAPALERWPAPEPGLVLAHGVMDARPTPRSPVADVAARSTGGAVPSPSFAVDVMIADQPVDITLLRPTRPAQPDAPASAGAGPQDAAPSTDHDGTTVLGHEVLALRRQLPEWTGHGVVSPLVLPAPATPAPARIALSTGDVVSLSRPVLLGRAPQATRVAGSQVPRLVTVPSPLQDISRTHAEVRMDGDDVVLTDLRSTNGVLVVQPAGAPQRLQPGEATVLQPGVLVDLGEGVTFTVERGA